MTASIHTYSATLKGSPDYTLKVKGGDLSLDSSRSPHVTASITIAPPSLTVINLLDPRLNKRIEVVVSRSNPTQTRTFNLGLRRRTINQRDLTVTLDLASDEMLLADYRATADDYTTFGLASSLRDVVDYVLDEAIPGYSLEATPSVDADVHPTWEVTNLHTNPEVVNTYGYGLGSGSTAITRVLFGIVAAIQWTATLSESIMVPTPSMDSFRVRQGVYYTFSIELLSDAAPRNAQLAIQWFAGDGTAPMQTVYGAAAFTNMVTWTTYTVTARAPVGAQSLVPLVVTYGNVPGEDQYAKSVMVYEGEIVVPAFSGDLPDDADYEYGWTDSAHGSPSIRIPLNDTPDPEALIWRAGQSAMDFLFPLYQAAGLRLVCNEARDWTLRDATYTASGAAVAITYGTHMTDGDETLDRDNPAWFDAAVTTYEWTDRSGIFHRMIDEYSPGTPTKVQHFEKATAYPGPGFSQYATERAELRGRELTASMVSDYSVSAERAVTITPYLTAAEAGTVKSVAFSLDRDEMTVTTRTEP